MDALQAAEIIKPGCSDVSGFKETARQEIDLWLNDHEQFEVEIESWFLALFKDNDVKTY